MKKNYIRIYQFLLLSLISFGCSKKELELTQESKLTFEKKMNTGVSVNSGGDARWDLLGYGYDVTGNLVDAESTSDAPIIDLQSFYNDYQQRIDVNTSTSGIDDFYIGASASDYLKDVQKKRAAGFKGTLGNNAEEKEPYFSGSISRNTEDQNIELYATKYSYATYESLQKIKRIRFNDDVNSQLLANYLTPDFVNNVSSLSASALVNRYGTHVLLDITLGGRLRMDYTSSIVTETETDRKVRATKVGLGVSVFKIFGLDLTYDVTKEETTRIMNESRNKQYKLKFYGGTNSGRSISFDSNGNTTENFNISSWQQSINSGNCALIDVGKTIFLYDLISDPVKKSQVKTAVENYIEAKKIKELGETPIYRWFASSTGDHFYTKDTYHPQYYVSEGIEFYAFPTAGTPNTIPIYRYFHTGRGDHYYSTTPFPPSNYVSEGVEFYAYGTQLSNTIPIYVYYASSNGDHYYTKDQHTPGGYVSEGIAFYVPR